MQVPFHKYTTIIWLWVLISAQPLAVMGQEKSLHTADSLFAIGRYSDALKIYQKKYEIDKSYNSHLLLKLAFLTEKANEPAQSLYYLSLIAKREPSERLMEKMSVLAADHNLKGYEFNDFGFFLVLYKTYGGYIPILLLSLGLYVVLVMVFKVKNGEWIQKRHKWAVIAYLVALLALLNVPSSYKVGVVKTPYTHIRKFPSSAAPVAETIRQGHKVYIIGNRDHWNRVIWDGKIVFIRKTDLWEV